MNLFQDELIVHFDELRNTLTTGNGDLVIKGFIDLYRNIYTISSDTKVISKIFELMLFPLLSQFAAKYNFRMYLCKEQNHYPDISFQASDGSLIALDLKSTYRLGNNKVNGLTLGAFTGYFRLRDSTKNITFPYNRYSAHYVLGVIYTRQAGSADERKIYQLEDLEKITSVVKNFELFLHEKWRIASDRPGSGNTKNIGSVTNIHALKNGLGPFSVYGVEVFDDYWMNYLTQDMAKGFEINMPYHNL